MIKTKVIKRYIQTLPIQDMIMRTDHLAESIQFELVNWIENIDYGAEGWQWFIYYRTTIDPPVVTPISYSVSEDGKHTYLLWEVDHNITKRSGNLDFQIRGKLDTDKGLIEWNSSVATINLGTALDPDDHDTDENILEWYLDRMEQLAQSGIADITAERDRAMAVEAELRADLDAEIERSITADNSLQQQVDEIKNSSNEELTQLRIDLTNEINRSQREDVRLTRELTSEVNRAKDAEKVITDNLNSEIERAKQEERNIKGAMESHVLDLTNKIEQETERAKQEERNIHGVIEDRTLQFTTALEAETERAKNEEQDIRNSLDEKANQLTEAINAETERATAAEEALSERLDNQQEDFTALIEAETKRATEAEQQIQSNLEAETERATAREDEIEKNLTDALNAETERATNRENEIETSLTESINTESNRAREAEKALDDKITAETERATEAETTLRSDLIKAIEAETERATTAEEQLQSNLDIETNRAIGRENEIEDALEAEVTRSTLADRNHDQAIEQAGVDLTNAKAELQSNINKEQQRAEAAEAQLQSNIDAEVKRATTAEEAISDHIDAVESSLTADLTVISTKLNKEIVERTRVTDALTTSLNDTATTLADEISRSTAEDQQHSNEISRLSGEITSANILEVTEGVPAGVAHRYILSITLDGKAETRGIPIDIPVSDAISDGYFDEESNELVFTLSDGNEVRIPFNDLIQYYRAGDGLELINVDHENNELRVKLDTTAGTQGILKTSVNGLTADLSNYYPKPDTDSLLAKKQNTLIEDNSQGTSTPEYYPPVTVSKDTDIISLNPNIPSDLGVALRTAQQVSTWVLNISGTTINGNKIAKQEGENILGVTIRLYESINGFAPPTEGNVLIAGKNGAYKDSTFTIAKSVPADAKFTDTLYYPTTENNPEGLFTREEQVKLEGIQKGAEVNVQADWLAEDGDAFIRNKPGLATQSEDGFMSSEDKTKLDSVDENAEENQNAFSTITVGTESINADSKTDHIYFKGEGSTTVSVDPDTSTITIKSEDVAQSDWNETDTESPAYIKNKPGLATPTKDGFMSASDKDKLDKVEDTYLPLMGGTMVGPINSQNVVPTANATYSSGSDTNRYQNVYASNGYFLGSPADGKGIFFNASTGGFDFIC